MDSKIVIITTLSIMTLAKGEEKWVWGDNKRDESIGRVNLERDPRYEVYEHERPFRPSAPYYERPAVQYRPEHSRPGGVYGSITNTGNYGQAHPHYPLEIDKSETGILTGPIPSWVKEGPYKNFDKCKCTEKFNCNSPGISYGHCDVGKQYCCYATKKSDQIGGLPPSRPIHSIENGILVGPGGPIDVPRPGGFNRPRPGGGFGLSGSGKVEYGSVAHRPAYYPDNGILVGPGGPFDRPNRLGVRPDGSYGEIGGRGGGGGGYGLSRSAKSN